MRAKGYESCSNRCDPDSETPKHCPHRAAHWCRKCVIELKEKIASLLAALEEVVAVAPLEFTAKARTAIAAAKGDDTK